MKKRLALSILSLGIAIALLATNLGQHQFVTSSVAEAGANFVTVADQQCLSPNQVRVAFTWAGYNEGPQWVDLSLSNNGFFPGTFVGLGPLASSQRSFTWDGILAGLTHFLRVNTLTAAGWSTSPIIAFTTRNDCQFMSQVPLGAGASNLALSEVCLLNGTPRIVLTWTSSNQGQQWLDNSAYSPYFEPNSFTSVGPFVSNQTSYNWDGLVPGSLHFIRINTGTPYGWIGSPASTFYVRTDCQATVLPTPTPAPVAAPTAVATATSGS
ncbi:MAG TPA: hypothetical protein VJB57_16555 [Dehalococcoidia bacterium]|nr:hypothetical protein [Dehalococcoidia bacterium]